MLKSDTIQNTIQIGYFPSLTPPGLIASNALTTIELNHKEWGISLIQGEVDAVLFPLWHLPLVIDNQITIGALTPRMNTKICLVKATAQESTPKLRELPAGFSVYSPYEIFVQQLKGIRSDLKATTRETADYWILPHFEIGLQKPVREEDIIFTFQPRELVPLPGSGVWAYVVRKDQIDVRKWLATIHHSATSKITNIERGVSKYFEDTPLAIYGTEDDNGYLHFSAFKLPHRRPVTYSSGTSHGLVSKLVESLNQ